jgi:oxalate decarboxylase
MHWHPNADEWNYWIKGDGRVTVFNTGPQAITANFHPGDVGYVKKALGHYVENIGDTDLVYMEIFRADRFEEVSRGIAFGIRRRHWLGFAFRVRWILPGRG